jgi:hypothetical protein
MMSFKAESRRTFPEDTALPPKIKIRGAVKIFDSNYGGGISANAVDSSGMTLGRPRATAIAAYVTRTLICATKCKRRVPQARVIIAIAESTRVGPKLTTLWGEVDKKMTVLEQYLALAAAGRAQEPRANEVVR